MADPQPPSPSRPVRDAYRLWSDRYQEETAVSALEDHAVGALAVPVEGRRLLDAGCGIGRRLAGAGAAGARSAVGVDLVPAMLAAGRARWPALAVAAADVRALPFADARFDVLWCRLALGHLPSIEAAYAELGRVTRAGGEAVVSDFHADAVRAGHTRSFRDAEGRVHEVEHHLHDAGAHERAARAGGWRLVELRDVAVGPVIRAFYERAGKLELYERQVGLALVLLLRFEKAG